MIVQNTFSIDCCHAWFLSKRRLDFFVMTYGLTEPFLLWENKRQLVMHGAKKILKQRHQQRNTTAWKDRVQSAVHIYKVILPAAPALSFCLVLPQTEWQCSSSPASQSCTPGRKGEMLTRVFLALMACCQATRSSQQGESTRKNSPGTAFFALASICSSTLLGPRGNLCDTPEQADCCISPSLLMHEYGFCLI